MLQKRSSGIYYFRWVYPLHIQEILGDKQLYKSLKTRDLSEAIERSSPLISFRKIILKMTESVSIQDYADDLVKALRRLVAGTKKRSVMDLLQLHTAEDEQDLEDMINLIELGDRVEGNKFTDEGDYSAYAAVLSKLGLSVQDSDIFDETPDFKNIYLRDFALGCLYVQTRNTPSKLIDRFNTLKPTLPWAYKDLIGPAKPQRELSQLISISEFWDKYEQQKILNGEWKSNSNTLKTYNTWFLEFLEILPENIMVTEISSSIAQQVIKDVRRIPAYRARRFGTTPLRTILGEGALLADRSIKERGSLINGFFSWLFQNEHIPKNPFSGLRWVPKTGNKPEQSYALYTPKDLTELFNLSQRRIIYQWQFWIPRVALFSGARQNEIAQLLKTDIIQSNDGIWYISVNDLGSKKLKTDNATRYVPIHHQLIENGFIEYCNSLESTSLWPDLKPKGGSLGQQVSSYWGETLKKKHNIPSEPTDERGARKVFHSFRHNLITALVDNGQNTTTIQRIAGHEPSLLGETATYTNKFSEANLKNCQDAINTYNPDVSINWQQSYYNYKQRV